jgi:hypothetical protein
MFERYYGRQGFDKYLFYAIKDHALGWRVAQTRRYATRKRYDYVLEEENCWWEINRNDLINRRRRPSSGASKGSKDIKHKIEGVDKSIFN